MLAELPVKSGLRSYGGLHLYKTLVTMDWLQSEGNDLCDIKN